MGKQPSIIELNGQKYDALTGKRISSSSQPVPRPRVVSDIAPAPKHHSQRTHTPSVQVHKTVQHSSTLMRHSVKKPSVQPKSASTHVAVNNEPKVVNSHPSTSMHRASQIQKSPVISRFGDISPVAQHHKSGDKHHPVLEVAKAPSAPPVIQAKAAHHKTTSEELIQKSLNSIVNPQKPLTHKRTKLRHRAAKRLKVSTKVINFAAGGMAVLLLGGFFAYQNVPNLAVRYAGMKAGINARLPSYHPTAFTVDKSVRYSAGQVAVSYNSNTDDRSYVITQKKTDWNSSELEAFMAKEAGKALQSYATDDGTIYIQNDNTKVVASTIEDGLLKNVSGDASLNTDQVIKIVSSM